MNVETLQKKLLSLSFFRTWLIVLLLALVGCGGNYQAPVRDQGERQINQAPIIVESSRTQSGGVVVERGSAIVSSGSSSAGPAVNGSDRVPVRSGRPVSSVSRSSATAVGSSSDNPTIHRVKAGDTLYSIAFQYDLDFRSVALANNLRAPYTIFVDQEISLDVSNLGGGTSGTSVTSSVGTAVSNNSVARAQGSASRSGGVLRQPIQSANNRPTWGWPHSGRVLRGFGQGDSKGLDIQGRVGDPVLAASAGDVVYSGRGIQGSGNLIILRHSDRYLSAYAHNSVMLVSEGARVAAGDKIAEVGQNPAGTAMLHFEIRLDGKSVDPNGLLPDRR